MGFLIVIAIIALVAGMMSRSKPTIQIDNDNAHKFSNSNFKQNRNINKTDLKEEIKRYYDGRNYYETRNKIDHYLKYYNEDLHINFMMVFSLVELRELMLAEKYASNVIYQLNNDKLGYFLLGYVKYAQNDITKSIDYMETAMRYGLPEDSIYEVIKDKDYLNRLFNNKNQTYDDYDDLPFDEGEASDLPF